jgi:hypothetical protein
LLDDSQKENRHDHNRMTGRGEYALSEYPHSGRRWNSTTPTNLGRSVCSLRPRPSPSNSEFNTCLYQPESYKSFNSTLPYMPL